jgi:hypothetical protein
LKPSIPDPTIKSKKELVHFADELTDSESTAAFELIAMLQMKYGMKRNSKENLEELRDEALTKLMEQGILAEVDVTPCFYGDPPILELRGKISGDSLHKHGFDHEKKKWEIDKAHDRGEDYLGEKESAKSRKEK